MASDFCPEIYCTDYTNKATELDLFPLRTPIAKPFPNTPSGGLCCWERPLQNEVTELVLLGHGVLLTANPKHK